MTRRLPSPVNPRLVEEIPPYKDLVDLRRLGQTNLGAKTSDAGLFAYVHLRAPLPPIQQTELFGAHTPESYFLMRRSSDGYVSCTGMFKASFPWATKKEEDEERKYVREHFPKTSKDETAGNLWVHPADAITLAEEYGMTIWIDALLDNHPVPSDRKRNIEAPPPFYKDGVEPPPPKEAVEPPPSVNEFLAPPSLSAANSSRRRSTRSTSPSKRHMSPRKARLAKSSVAVKDIPIRADSLTFNLNGTREREKSETPATTTENEAEPVAKTIEAKEETAAEAKEVVTAEVKEKTTTEVKEKKAEVKEVKEDAVADAKKEKKTEVKGETTTTTVETTVETTTEEVEVKKEPVVKVEVDNVSKTNGEVKVEKTHVKVEYPAEEEVKFLPIPDKEDMMAKARAMVEESRKLDGELQGRKRINKEISGDQEEEEPTEDDSEAPPQLKKSRVLEEQLKKEKIKTKSLIALSVGLTLTALIPHFL